MVDRLIDEVSGSVRRARQEASHTLAGMLADDPNALGDKLPAVAEAMIDALFRPEAQTRWEDLTRSATSPMSTPRSSRIPTRALRPRCLMRTTLAFVFPPSA